MIHAPQRQPRPRWRRLLAGLWCAAAMLPAAADPAAGDAPLPLDFHRVFRMPVGPHGLEFSEALQAADGRQVRLVGFMVNREQPVPGRFQLASRPVRLSEQADGEADDLPPQTVTVLLDAAQRDRVVAFRPGPLALTGRLSVGRAEEAAGRVSWLRLQLAPDALAEAAASRPHPLPSAH